MRKIEIKAVMFLILLAMSYGCASQTMVPAPVLKSVDNDKALVTFMMTGQTANPFPTFQFEFDIWDSEKFIGALSRYTYFQYLTDPGEHLFMARGGNRSFVKANLQAGRKYYVFVNLSIKPFYQNVYFEPVKKENKELIDAIPSYLKDLQPMSMPPKQRDDYIKDRIEDVKNEIEAFGANEYDYSTLDAQDGIE
ncbi:MAG: hypothetical protein P8X96_03545 [Desulfobacteraceae bacterium]